MSPKEVQELEKTITQLKDTVSTLSQSKAEIEREIERIEDTVRVLIAMLPPDNRIQHLFSR